MNHKNIKVCLFIYFFFAFIFYIGYRKNGYRLMLQMALYINLEINLSQ